MGKLEVKILQVGRGHSKGDTIVWLPSQKVLFAGDLVEYGATPYCGDAYYTHWAKTLDNLTALGAEKLVPGRGAALKSAEQVRKASRAPGLSSPTSSLRSSKASPPARTCGRSTRKPTPR